MTTVKKAKEHADLAFLYRTGEVDKFVPAIGHGLKRTGDGLVRTGQSLAEIMPYIDMTPHPKIPPKPRPKPKPKTRPKIPTVPRRKIISKPLPKIIGKPKPRTMPIPRTKPVGKGKQRAREILRGRSSQIPLISKLTKDFAGEAASAAAKAAGGYVAKSALEALSSAVMDYGFMFMGLGIGLTETDKKYLKEPKHAKKIIERMVTNPNLLRELHHNKKNPLKVVKIIVREAKKK